MLTRTEQRRIWAQDYAERHPERVMWREAKRRAMKRGWEFTIKVSDIQIPERCPCFGIPLLTGRGHGWQPDSPSLDRKDPRKGYTPENIWVICALANKLKSDRTPEELIAFARPLLQEAGYVILKFDALLELLERIPATEAGRGA